MSTRDQLLDDLCNAPNDWDLRGVLADWYEDNNFPDEAACLRWMIQQRKRPYHGANRTATWFNADKVRTGLGDPESDIPAALFQLLEGGREVGNHKRFPTICAAEESLLAAWRKAGGKITE
jgi:uncharacterized protein (TIGR02996 family)